MSTDVMTRPPQGPPAGTVLAADRRGMPSEMLGHIDFSVILVAGEVGDYKAYRGNGSDAFIAAQGDPLSYKEALVHFPIGLEEKLYRR